MRKFYWILLGVCVLALLPRLYSIEWNAVTHGDIIGDTKAAASYLREQRLLVSEYTDLTSTPHFYPPGIGRNLLVAHPPVWALLGAGVSYLLQFEPTEANAFYSLKLLSLLFGMVVIILAAAIALSLFDRASAIAISVWLAFSYLMIDFSGNGALYSLQAALYLGWILVAYSSVRNKAVALGAVSGLGYLVNHQAVVLVAASVVVLLFNHSRPWSKRGIDLVLTTIVTLLVVSPWLMRNYLVYGDPLFSHAVNSTYVYTKAALLREVINGREQFILGLSGYSALVRSIITSWLPNNLYYVARKLFILAPIIFFFFSFAWIDYVFSRERTKALLPILVLLIFHLLISTIWPITKFRYFVPMLPLVFLIGLDQIRSLQFTQRVQSGIFCAITVSILFLSYLTYAAIPTHTYYYNGAITQDPFHSRGEYEFMVEQGLIEE